jgi:hypothetical protein
MARYNDKEKKWEAGEDITNGLYSDVFKDLGTKAVLVRIKLRDDRKAISQILVRPIPEKGKP